MRMTWGQFNDQFRETEYERNQRLRKKRLEKLVAGRAAQTALDAPGSRSEDDTKGGTTKEDR